MTATEELRRLLDERGVEYEGGERSLRWRDRNGVMMQAFPLADGELWMDVWSCTPEQAIAATLGSCNCTNDCTNGERTGTCLPHFWTHDGALHIEATRMPTRIVVCEGGTCEFVPKRELDASEAENAKLREELANVPKCETCEAMLDCDECLRADGSHKERRRLSAENARLRSELESVGTVSYLYGRSDLKAENAKLRKLCETVIDDWMSKVCPSFPFCEFGGEYQDCTDETCGNQIYRQMARELGVEVDE